METETHYTGRDEIVPQKPPLKIKRCLSCGTGPIEPRRRYCSSECRQQLHWVLSLSKGLLKTFNARYAAFSFTKDHVILDVLPAWSNNISQFVCDRSRRKKPAADLKALVLQSGEEYYHLIKENNSRSAASLCLLERNHNKKIPLHAIKPDTKSKLRISKQHRDCLKILQLEMKDLDPESRKKKIQSAYKKMAKLLHPDVGGDSEKFKRLNEAHKQMLHWVENPQYTSRKALPGCWSYDGSTNRWSPPL